MSGGATHWVPPKRRRDCSKGFQSGGTDRRAGSVGGDRQDKLVGFHSSQELPKSGEDRGLRGGERSVKLRRSQKKLISFIERLPSISGQGRKDWENGRGRGRSDVRKRKVVG